MYPTQTISMNKNCKVTLSPHLDHNPPQVDIYLTIICTEKEKENVVGSQQLQYGMKNEG